MQAGKSLTGKQLRQQQKQQNYVAGPGIIACHIRTPENMANILRVADSAGASQVIFCGDTELPQQKKYQRIARSANQHVPFATISESELLNTIENYQPVLALEITDQSERLYDISLTQYPWVMLGSESRGIPETLLAVCEAAVHIPMFGELGSMNVSHALAVYLFEWRRQFDQRS